MTRWAILTGEYPPQPGGVSDYSQLVARGLAGAGDAVRVYAPPYPAGPDPADPGVIVRRLADHFGPRGLLALDRDLARPPRPDRVLIQYVPHAFGMKAINLPFAAWVAARAHQLSPVWVMFHEVLFPFRWRPVSHAVLGAATRMMARWVAGAADRVFVSTPGWADILRRVCPRARRAEWLPVPCGVATTADPVVVAAVRARFAPGPADRLVGHFGTFGPLIGDLLDPAVRDILRGDPQARLLLIGRGSAGFLDRFAGSPDLARRVAATGDLPPAEVAAHLRACDVLVQPYPDGVTARRTSTMAGMANGVPVVTNRGALSEPFWASTPGVTVAPTPDPAQVSAAVRVVLGLPAAARAEMGRRAAETYRAAFSLDHTLTGLRLAGPDAEPPTRPCPAC